VLLFVQITKAQNEFTNKMEELVDKLTSSAIISYRHSDPNRKLTKENVVTVSGIDMKSVFRRLENSGFRPGSYNKDDLTRLSESVRRFQKIAKLKADGILDSATWAKMQKLYDPMETGTNPESRKTPQAGNAAQKRGSSPKASELMEVRQVALMGFAHGDQFGNLAGNVFESLSVCLVNKGFQVTERSQLGKVLREQNMSDAGITDTSTAQKLGKSLESEVAVIGNITDMGNNVIVRARVIDVENGLTMAAAEVGLRKTPEIIKLIEDKSKNDRRVSVKPSSPDAMKNKGLFFENDFVKIDVISFTRQPEGLVLKLRYMNRTKKAFRMWLRNPDDKTYLADEIGKKYPFKILEPKDSNTLPAGVPRLYTIVFRDLKTDVEDFIYSVQYRKCPSCDNFFVKIEGLKLR